MAKSKALHQSALPVAPWVYINDPTPDGSYATRLAALIPSTVHLGLSRTGSSSNELLSILRSTKCHSSVPIISDKKDDHENYLKLKTVKDLRTASIKHGCNFVSINIFLTRAEGVPKIDDWGTNHVHVDATEPGDIAEKMYRWLFTVLAIPETLHLIPEEQMKEVDNTSFPEYVYCPINESRLRPKDAKIQFVALVLSKPEVGPDQRLNWAVVDRTGVANFYFQYRDAQSQYTWDWVLALKPGDRKALPRMPMIEIKEKKRVTVIKAPFRGAAAVIGGTGVVIKGVGRSLCKLGHSVKLGERSEWVPEADLDADGRKIEDATTGQVKIMPAGKKTEIKVFNEKGEKAWSDKDSLASTEAGSIFNEKTGKEFV